jgi:hypothetical protein
MFSIFRGHLPGTDEKQVAALTPDGIDEYLVVFDPVEYARLAIAELELPRGSA